MCEITSVLKCQLLNCPIIHLLKPSEKVKFYECGSQRMLLPCKSLRFVVTTNYYFFHHCCRPRSSAPPSYTHCKLQNAINAFEVDEHMKEAAVALQDSELEAVSKISVQVGLEDNVYSVLHRFRPTVKGVSPAVGD